jgi:hypothetical protein
MKLLFRVFGEPIYLVVVLNTDKVLTLEKPGEPICLTKTFLFALNGNED